jgi:hypothetical protein
VNENTEKSGLGSLGFLTHGRSSGKVPQRQGGPHKGTSNTGRF